MFERKARIDKLIAISHASGVLKNFFYSQIETITSYRRDLLVIVIAACLVDFNGKNVLKLFSAILLGSMRPPGIHTD